jgi:diguanylate cyclase (GGDEF)-like protein/PAS domain S-box-containing protein
MTETSASAAGRGVSRGDPGALLAGEHWKDRLPDALAAAAIAIGADRCYAFENLRGSDGRLWMDLIGEWTAPAVRSLFDEPEAHLHPYAPEFQAWIEAFDHGREIVGAVEAMQEPARGALLAEGTVVTWLVPIVVGDEWWGFVGADATEPRDWNDADGDIVRAVANAVGEAARRGDVRTEQAQRQDRFRSLVEDGPLVTYIDAPDEAASAVYVSPQIEALIGYTVQQWMGDADLWPRILHPDDRARALAENARHNETGEPFELEYRMLHRDGQVVWVHDQARVVRDERGKIIASHGVMLDVTARKRADEQLAFRTYHDELTGLPSREMFEELVELSVARARRHDGAVAVLCVDLVDFRLVNDSLGHRAGDGLLVAVADRLREATRETDLVARRGGDQFLLLLADLDRDDTGPDGAVLRAESVAQRVHESLAEPFTVDGTEVYIGAGVGISLFPRDADDAAALARNAETAMFEAKRTGGTNYVLSGGAEGDSGARLHFVTRLRKAVDAQRWTLYYQPVVDLEDGRMVGVEALIRWIEPDGTIIPPNDFIPLAEELGLIERIGDWVVRELTYQVSAWRELDIDLEVGFNLSPRQFWQPDLAERIQREFRMGGVDPSRVLVEVTESSAMMDPDRAQRILQELTDAGFSIAIDDFGTGYSSLSRLRHMPVRVLKIDRSFVTKVHEDRQAASIVAAFLELASGLDLVTLAEGIETPEELAFLRERGCKLGQGFYFSKPVPPEEIIAFAFGGIPTAMALRAT